MSELRVELHGNHVGDLRGTGRYDFDFAATVEAIDRYGIGSTAMSLAVPFEPTPNRGRKNRRQIYFAGLLPEGDMLDGIVKNIGGRTSTSDVMTILAYYGRDVAGALQIYDPEHPGEPRTPSLVPVDDDEIARLLAEPFRSPLGNRRAGGKTSLAGVQHKIVLAKSDGGWNQVVDGYPSTHILKPAPDYYPTMIFDEEFGARMARAVGLAPYGTELVDFDGVPALVIERYDRSGSAPQGRVHQEDMSQVLGASGDQKYQEYGGVVSLNRVAGVFAGAGDSRSLRQLVQMMTVSVAVGNLDMHAKNISVLHPHDGPMTLAPAYDMVPQTRYDNDGKLALAINDRYAHTGVTLDDLVAEARSWGMRDAAPIVAETLEVVRHAAAAEEPDPRSDPETVPDILRFAQNLLDGRAVGA